ncbi:Lrp/AsnC family transcriptional regulator [Candidatus Woesearchaeota archaeon]|nr:Lrp/AsnC family transcriptional regulator [Candidatus Woesearchaeota archaeon]
MHTRKDFAIISYLRQNSRIKLSKIFESSRIPISTIYDNLKVSNKETITKYTCLVDFAKLGFNARAKLVIHSKLSRKKELLDFLLNHPNINSVYKINNGYDFLAEAIFPTMNDLEELIDTIKTRFRAKRLESYYIIGDLKREAFLSDPKMLNLVI